MENPYAAPASSVNDQKNMVPEDVLKKIRNVWVAAIISAGMTLLITLIAMSGTELMGFSAWQLMDVALILGLAFGIYKKSRTCAVLMFVYFIASKIMLMAQSGAPNGIFLAIMFGYFYWQGVSGTFSYNKIIKS